VQASDRSHADRLEILTTWPGPLSMFDLQLGMLAAALAVDAVFGDPVWLWSRVPHPIVALGALVGWLDRRLNRPDLAESTRKRLGVAALVVLLAVSMAIGTLLQYALLSMPYGWIGITLVAAIFLAGRSLADHVGAVAAAFATGGLGEARRAVSHIVGRDPDSLDEGGVARAAIESLAENFSDGVVAPAFWFALLGIPGLLAYKAVNTADSMIGHRNEHYRAFGWASARLDDLVNLPASRLAGFLIAAAAPLAGGSPGGAVRVMLTDAGKHRSPNAGWPESAMAVALGIAVAGPRRYADHVVDDPFLNAGGRTAASHDIARALRVYRGAWAALFLVVVLSALAVGGLR
jgi:adenosylcobinamide-phosphate synthase